MNDAPELADEAADQATLSEDVRRLIDQGKALARAELAWQKARAAYAGRQAGGIALLGALAAALAFFALMAMVVGALIALGPVLGAWDAVAAVAGALFAAALIAAATALFKARRTARRLADRPDAP